eukprot:1937545-Pyramimonas_sp.AAC.1
MCDDLTARSAIENNAEFQTSQQMLGITYNSDALPFDLDLRRVYKPISSVCWDWMHIYCTSGGFMQYHLNEMCLDIMAAGITLAMLDEQLVEFIDCNKSQIRSLG